METLRKASVQYGDMIGTAALDFHGGTQLHELAAHIGATGFPVALQICPLGMDRRSPQRFLLVTVYTADVNTADELQQYARDNGDRVSTKRFEGRLTLDELARYVKRFEIVLQSRVAPNAKIEHEEA